MADVEAPVRLSDALESFKADLNVNFRNSGAFAALKVSAVMCHKAAPCKACRELRWRLCCGLSGLSPCRSA